MWLHMLKREALDSGMIKLSGPCALYPAEFSHAVTVRADELRMYERGALAQEAFPNLSRDDREFLISGASPEGWAKMFSGDDGDDEDDLDDGLEAAPIKVDATCTICQLHPREIITHRQNDVEWWVLASACSSCLERGDGVTVQRMVATCENCEARPRELIQSNTPEGPRWKLGKECTECFEQRMIDIANDDMRGEHEADAAASNFGGF